MTRMSPGTRCGRVILSRICEVLSSGLKSASNAVALGSANVMAHSYRPSWSGSIRLSLVSVPVKGYTALEAEKARISLNQLHEECHSRIKYKKTCPVHGEVPNDEIVLGHQYGPDQYAVIDPDEVNKLRPERERAVNIDRFVSPDQIDPIYYSGQTYYLLPDGKQGPKPYAVLQKAMQA